VQKENKMGYLYYSNPNYGFFTKHWMTSNRSVHTIKTWTATQLKELAKEIGLANVSKYRSKYELYVAIENKIKDTNGMTINL
jgi:hypothetical protein